MIELHEDQLVFTFPEVHPKARLRVEFQRTLRIPDDGKTYPLPAGLGAFPLRHVDDFASHAPERWLERGGVTLPMYQSEALWIRFEPELVAEHGAQYPFAIKVAAGKVNAVTGAPFCDELARGPQDYLVAPVQPWLDGYCVERGVIRQFVAMPLGSGYSAEEQLTSAAEHGGIQIAVQPMAREEFERRFPRRRADEREIMYSARSMMEPAGAAAACDMGLAPGGTMHQEIYDDPYGLRAWERGARSRCFVHVANSLVWQALTGARPPTPPPTAREYEREGLPWFEYYADRQSTAVPGAQALRDLKSVVTLAKDKRDNPLPDNQSVVPSQVVALRAGLARDQVREGSF